MDILDEGRTKTELPLRRNWRFQALWIGGAGAVMSFNIASVVVPLLVLAITGSPVAAGLYALTEGIAAFASGVPAGVVLDRFNRRTLLIGAELVRAGVFALVTILLAFDELTFPVLLVAAGITGALQPLAGGARMLATRSVVSPGQLTVALTQEEVRTHTAAIVGPAIAGVFYATSRFLATSSIAVGYLLSALGACAMPRDRGTAQSVPGLPRGGMLSGFSYLIRTPLLRASIIAIGLLNLAGAALELIVIVLIQSNGGSSSDVGFAFAIAAIGGLAGTTLVGPLHKLRPGWLLIALCTWAGVITTGFLIPPFGPWWYGLVLGLIAVPIPAAVVLIDILIFRQVEDAQRGRTITATITVLTIGPSLGPLTAGFLLQYVGAVDSVAVFSAVFLASAAYALSNTALRRARWPEPVK